MLCQRTNLTRIANTFSVSYRVKNGLLTELVFLPLAYVKIVSQTLATIIITPAKFIGFVALVKISI